ncbi:MAG: hypothetical protein RLZZ253_3276 [Verrucomicrobiota bacterium]
MNFDLDDNQLMFRDTVERFCAPVDVARRHTMRRMDGGFDRNRWKDLADLEALEGRAGRDPQSPPER